jgi:Phage derived protein Gp49-like (DUF891)
VTWTVTFYNQRVEDEILALPTGFVARFLRYAERMEAFGPDLGMPHTRSLGGGLFELRIKAAVPEEDGQDTSQGASVRAAENEGHHS